MKNSLISYKIVNIVASSKLEIQIDLNFLHTHCSCSQYNPNRYHALKYKNNSERGTILVLKNGKLVFCGATQLEIYNVLLDLLIFDLKKLGYSPVINQINITNIVFVVSMPFSINLENLSMKLQFSQYEPEIFPGLIFKSIEPKFTAMIFSSGKISITGLRNFNSIEMAIALLNSILKRDD